MKDSDQEPSSYAPDDLANTSNQVTASVPDVFHKRRLWIVILLFIFGPGLPFAYCGNLKLGIKIAIFLMAIGAIFVSLTVVFSSIVYLISALIISVLLTVFIFIYAIRYAIYFNRRSQKLLGPDWPSIILFLIIATVADEFISFSIKTTIVEAYSMPSGSMENTILVGDYLMADKFVFGARLPIPFTDIHVSPIAKPEINDIVLFKSPEDPQITFIKRCVATEGQSVEIINKQLFVDGELIPLPATAWHSDINLCPHTDTAFCSIGSRGKYIVHTGNRDNMPEIIIPKGMIFVLGDNRDNSADSRNWGCIDQNDILGKATIIYWSWTKYDVCDSSVTFPRPPEFAISRPWSIIQCLTFNICHFSERVRWSRIGQKLN